MDDVMKRAGWRPMPRGDGGETILRRWERRGQWQFVSNNYALPDILYRGDWIEWRGEDVWCRPIDPKTGDHAAWMWAEATGESLEPTAPGYHWQLRYGEWTPIKVTRCGREGDPRFGKLFVLDPDLNKWTRATNTAYRWGGPCLGMPPEGKP